MSLIYNEMIAYWGLYFFVVLFLFRHFLRACWNASITYQETHFLIKLLNLNSIDRKFGEGIYSNYFKWRIFFRFDFKYRAILHRTIRSLTKRIIALNFFYINIRKLKFKWRCTRLLNVSTVNRMRREENLKAEYSRFEFSFPSRLVV